jgi:hypothetical protein
MPSVQVIFFQCPMQGLPMRCGATNFVARSEYPFPLADVAA